MPTALHTRTPELSTNYLLASLPTNEFDQLRPHLDIVYFDTGDTIYWPHTRFQHAYFPLTGIASIITKMLEGQTIEVGIIGREGLLGQAILYDTDGGPLATIAQSPGHYARLPVAALCDNATPNSTLYRLIAHFNQALYTQTAQSSGCNRVHRLDERCARWLLVTQDRIKQDTFRLTHEFLGYMLGVRRSSVTLAMGTLQKAKLITYQRGNVTITDRAGLEDVSCECYTVITSEYKRLMKL